MAERPLRVGILGASGYGGAGLLTRLARHPRVEVTGIASRQYEGQPLAACWPQFAGVPALDALRFADTDAVIDASEVLFCATPHGATAPLVARARAAGRRVVDLSADFRLPAGVYAAWYREHPHPELLDEAVYGLVELARDELPGAAIVAAPGCNATAASLALAPLAAAGWLGPEVVVNVITGASGAGRAPSSALHFAELNENARPYKAAGSHRHTAEVEAVLARLDPAGEGRTVTFTPHLVPMTRGIVATASTRPERAPDDAALLARYREFYAGHPLLRVQEQLPETKAVWGSDRALVSVRRDARSGHLVAFAAIDNLGKGAAGQAVQAFNLAFGFEETLGLTLEGAWP